jgi:metallo-beta-lactamase family protein
MKIKFLGAAGTVTGSSYVLTSGSGHSILIDLGSFQGTDEIERLNYKRYEFDCSKLIGAILTHAHLDHCGRLPILFNKGFNGSIWMTAATRDLTEISLMDSAKIAQLDHKNGKEVLYDKDQAQVAIDRTIIADYHTPFEVGDFTVTMKDAGHILGSTSLELVDRFPDSDIKKVVFSGDLGNSPEDLVPETEFIETADVVIMESTYGDKYHDNKEPADIVQSEINTIEKTGGTLLIPAFSLERTQELLHIIMHLKKEGKVRQETPVFLDSPMAEKATYVYMDYPDMLNKHIQEDLKTNAGAFNFPGLDITGTKTGK